jgi:pimeloyl-ACP methyl ester carboxylesterase
MPEYHAEGEIGAPVVVFLHGARLARAVWARQTAEFSDRYRTVAVDLPGHGELAHVPFGLAAFIERLSRIVDAESRDGRAVLVGHSLGGYVAIGYAARHPDRTAGLVVCNATIEPRRLLATPYRSLTYVAGLAGQRIRGMVADRIRTRAYRSMTAGAAGSEGPAARAGAAGPSPGGGLVFKGSRYAVRDIIGQQFIPKLHSYPGPVLLVNGADDRVFRRDEQAFLAASRDGVLRVVEGAGHLPYLESPEEFDEALRRFLDSIHW